MKQLSYTGQCNRTTELWALAGVMQQLIDFPGSWNTHTWGGTSYHHLRLICVTWCALNLLILVGSGTAFWPLWSGQNKKDEIIFVFMCNLLMCNLMYVYFPLQMFIWEQMTMIWDLCCVALLGCYVAFCGSCLPKFWDSVSDS